MHIVQRGNNRQICFREEQDRSFYLFHLRRLLRSAGCALHAYCLMTNHVHLLVTADEADGCAVLMKHLGQLHTQYVNRTYGRTGSLWEGRFRSCLVQSEAYVLACYRYIELNPVRAGLVTGTGDYPWSSYLANIGEVHESWITPHAEYLALGESEGERRAVYRCLFGSELQAARIEEIRVATNGNFALGDARFRREISAAAGRRAERGRPGRPAKDVKSADLDGRCGGAKRGLSLI
jgi:putative transposase